MEPSALLPLETGQHFQKIMDHAPVAISILHGPHFSVQAANKKQLELWQKTKADVLHKDLFTIFPETDSPDFKQLLNKVYQTGEPYSGHEMPAHFWRNGTPEQDWFNFFYEPIRNDAGHVEGIMIVSAEIKEPFQHRDLSKDNGLFQTLHPPAETKEKFSDADLLRLYEKVVVNINDAVLITEAEPIEAPDGPRIVFVNEAFTRMTGYLPEEVIGKTPRLLQGEKTDRKELDKIKAALKDWKAVRVELTNYRKDGSEFDVEFEMVPVADEKGWFTHWVSVQRDVTVGRKAAEAIKKSEQKFQELIFSSHFLIAIFAGREMVIETANKAILQAWGKGEEILGKTVAEVMPEVIEQGFGEILDDVFTSGKPYYAYEKPVYLNKHGKAQLGYYTFVYQPQRGITGEVEGVAVIANEVTSQGAQNKKIKESEEYFRQLSNLIPDKITTADPQGNVNYYNQNWEEFTGKSLEELLKTGWAAFIHPDDIPMVADQWQKAISTAMPLKIELRMINKQGESRWHLTRATPVKDEAENVTKWIGSMTDIQDQKEQSLKFERAVAQRTLELQKINTQLSQSNEDLQRFAHVASHDLREPLRKIIIFANRVKDDEQTFMSDKSETYLSNVLKGSKRLDAMIQGVLSYSLVNASENPVETIELNRIIDDIADDLEILIEQKGRLLKQDPLPQIVGAPVLIYQLFYNLIYNAFKFAKENESQIVSISSRVIQIGAVDFAEIMIKDQGIGFSPKESENIFVAFSRLHSKDKYEGTGMGLTLCKRIVEQHGGTIKAIGQVNEGAVFTVSLPIVQAGKILKTS